MNSEVVRSDTTEHTHLFLALCGIYRGGLEATIALVLKYCTTIQCYTNISNIGFEVWKERIIDKPLGSDSVLLYCRQSCTRVAWCQPDTFAMP